MAKRVESTMTEEAQAWADRQHPYPKMEPWAAGLAGGWLTFAVLYLFCRMVDVPDGKAWPGMALMAIVAGGGTFLEVRQRANRHLSAYWEALDRLREERD